MSAAAGAVRGEVGRWRQLGRCVHSEWLRVRSVEGSWWLLACASILMLGLGGLGGYDARAQEETVSWTATVGVSVLLTQLILTQLAVQTTSSEYSTRGILPTLQWTPRRHVLLTARTIVLVALIAACGLALSVANGVMMAAVGGESVIIDSAGATMLWRATFVLGCGAALGVGVGALTRSSAGGLAVMLLLMLMGPLILPGTGSVGRMIGEALPGSGAAALLVGVGPEISEMRATLTLLAWGMGGWVVGWWRFGRGDAQ